MGQLAIAFFTPGASRGVSDKERADSFLIAVSILDFHPVVIADGHDRMASLDFFSQTKISANLPVTWEFSAEATSTHASVAPPTIFGVVFSV